MGIKIKNLQTGEFEKFNIPALKGEKGEPGEIEPSEKVDYIGKQHSKLRDTMNANVDYIIKTAISEFNYLDYEGQHITATNSIEGHSKSAILSGQTLVNLFKEIDRETTVNTNYSFYKITGSQLQTIKPNTQYTLIFDSYIDGISTKIHRTHTNELTIEGYQYGQKIVFTTMNNVEGEFHVFVRGDTLEITQKMLDLQPKLIILEGDYTNVDIPYFNGIQSVKMPVLTTVGKNVVNEKIWKIEAEEEGYQCLLSAGWATETTKNGNPIIIPVHVEKGKVYTLKCKNKATKHFNDFYFMDDLLDGKVKSFRKSVGKNTTLNSFVDTIITFTADRDYKYLQIDTGNGEAKGYIVKNTLQLEEGSIATPYEPYKSNILSTPEEVVLREVNGVRDTLNLMTGEYVQRIGEVVLDGTSIPALNKWEFGSDCTEFNFNAKGIKGDGVTLSNFAKSYLKSNRPRNTETVSSNNLDNTYVLITIQKSKLATDSVEGMNQYLQSNPITIQYELKTPVIKTVDLSDNHVYSYKGTTHYSCSSEEGSLVPTLSVKVPTDTQLTIQEQKATTQTLLIKNMDLQQSIKEVQAMNLAFNTALYNSFNSIREEVEDIKKHVSTNENLEGSF